MADFSLILDGSTARVFAQKICAEADLGTVVEWTKSNRTLEQNAALHGLIDQIRKQRPIHCGLRMTVPLYKAVFMHALGEETRFVPSLDGTTVFPLGLSTKALSKERFSDLIEYILAWCAKEGLTVRHFDEPTPSSSSQETGVELNKRPEAVS